MAIILTFFVFVLTPFFVGSIAPESTMFQIAMSVCWAIPAMTSMGILAGGLVGAWCYYLLKSMMILHRKWIEREGHDTHGEYIDKNNS